MNTGAEAPAEHAKGGVQYCRGWETNLHADCAHVHGAGNQVSRVMSYLDLDSPATLTWLPRAELPVTGVAECGGMSPAAAGGGVRCVRKERMTAQPRLTALTYRAWYGSGRYCNIRNANKRQRGNVKR